MHKTALEKNKLLLDFAKDKLSREKIDYFVFGHQHAPLQEKMGPAIYFNLGDWLEDYTYAVWDGEKLKLEKWPST